MRDYTNQRFGKLVALRRVENKGPHAQWECICDCGKTSLVVGYALKRGSIQSCGCLKHIARAGDLTGKRFGRLIVISRAEGNEVPWNCLCDCGRTVTIKGSLLRHGSTRSCGCLRKEVVRVNNAKKRISDRRITKAGYVLVFNPNHPNANKTGYVFEHVMVMADKLGRALFPGENVHHLNGQRNDNRPENLELWVRAQPAGIRASDALKWAEEIIRRYGNKVELR